MSCPVKRKQKEVKLNFKPKNYETVDAFQKRLKR